MICRQENHLWLGRFSVALMRLRQGTSLPAAVSRAVRAHERLHDMDPEDAAVVEAMMLARRFGDGARRPMPRQAIAR
jgi:hypothetical protein